jgi:hypothetical protein
MQDEGRYYTKTNIILKKLAKINTKMQFNNAIHANAV